jgi:hypothetical protein
MKLKRTIFIVTIMAACLLICAGMPAWATVYYVSTAGDDTTGDGSIGTPWRSVNKALTTIPLTAGPHTLNIGAGTYAETSGTGSLKWGRLYGTLLTIQTTSGNPDVTITNTTAADGYMMQNTAACSHMLWKNITFSSITGTTWTWLYKNQTSSTDISFIGCTFNSPPDAGAGLYAIQTAGGAGTFTSDFTFTNCVFNHATGSSGNSIWFNTPANQTISITMINCTSTSNATGVVLDGNLMTVNIQGGNFSNSGASAVAFLLGTDNAGAGHGVTGTVRGITASSTSSHALEIGDGCVNVTVTGCKADASGGGDYALIGKGNGVGCVFQSNLSIGGSLGALMIKSAANGGKYQDNVLKASSGPAVMNTDGSSQVGANVIFRNNRIITTSTANVFNWAAAMDTSGAIFDYNTYDLRGTGNYGTVQSTAGITSLSGLQSAWIAYGGANESHSQLALNQYLMQTKYTSTGSWLYAQIQNSQGQLWNGAAFETPTAANYPLYNIPLVEDPAGGFYYNSSFPLQATAGKYVASYYVRSGNVAAATDSQVGNNLDIFWNGTSVYYQTGDSYARLGQPVGLSHAADVAAVKSDSLAIKSKTDSLLFDGSSFVKANTQATAASLTFNQVGTVSGTVGGIAGVVIPATIPSVAQIAGSLLLTPANLIATDSSGRVTLTPAEHGLISSDLLSATVFGSVTVKQVLGTSFGVLSNDLSRTWNASTHTATVVAYACQPGSSAADHTRPLVTQVTVYDSTNTQIVSRSTTFSNLP